VIVAFLIFFSSCFPDNPWNVASGVPTFSGVPKGRKAAKSMHWLKLMVCYGDVEVLVGTTTSASWGNFHLASFLVDSVESLAPPFCPSGGSVAC